jgi:hypothetical protein
MRSLARTLALALALVGVAGLLVTASGAASDGPIAVEYGKKAKKKKAKKKKKAIKNATKAIQNGQYLGTRGDGEAVDWTFCKNGKYHLKTTGSGGTGISSGKGWRVAIVKQTKHGFWAIVKFGRGGEIALSVSRKQWKVGISYFDAPSNMGKATRGNAKKYCGTL